MSTPQWFAEFERQEAMREERLDETRARVAEWRESMAAERAYQYAIAHPEPIPEGYELVEDGSTQEGDIITRTNTGSFVEKIIRHLRPVKKP
jgi:hypothetical protein